MTSLASNPLTSALAQALMHFVWQGALIGLIAFAVWRLRRLSPHARYLTGIVALAAMLIAPLATTAYLMKTAAPPAPAAALDDVLAAANGSIANGLSASYQSSNPGAPPQSVRNLVILAVWIAGVVGLSLRLLGGWVVARRLATRAVRPISDELAAISQRIAERLAIDRVVAVFESSAISVPVMVGWLRPVVLIPTAVLAGLTPIQIEALLAHELAHVRRHDYLVNLLQAVVETLLFYHPAVWWVSSRVRAEREHCCDDLVVSVCDRLTYATALTDLAAMTTPRMALAATDGSLIDRVRRILGQPQDAGRAPNGWAPAVLMVLAVGALVPGAVKSNELIAQRAGLIASDVTVAAQSGVPAGVPGGVATGVPRGKASGKPGGSASGTPGGVVSGVPGGVPGGIVGGIPGDDQQSTEEERRRTARELAELKARLEQLAAQQSPEQEVQTQKILELLKADLATREAWLLRQRNLDQERAKIKLDQMEGDRVGQEKEREIKIASLRRQLEDNKRRVEAGVIPKDVVEQIETELQAVLAQREAAQRDRSVAMRQFELESRESQERAEFELKQLQLEQAKQELVAKEMGYRALIEKVRDSGSQDARSEAERKAELAKWMDMTDRAAREYSAAAWVTEENVDQNREVRAGDLLRIEVQGEPNLPTRYEVTTDGTIRIPFLGVMNVAGRTPAQIREQLQRALMERKLVERPEVAVRIVR